jgi:hypothetical protein
LEQATLQSHDYCANTPGKPGVLTEDNEGAVTASLLKEGKHGTIRKNVLLPVSPVWGIVHLGSLIGTFIMGHLHDSNVGFQFLAYCCCFLVITMKYGLMNAVGFFLITEHCCKAIYGQLRDHMHNGWQIMSDSFQKWNDEKNRVNF